MLGVSAAVLGALLSRQQQLFQRASPLASSHPSVSPWLPPLSPGLRAQRVLVMMAFLDGIKLSLPAAVSHANDIVCRVDGVETPTVSLYRNSFFFFAMPFSVALLRLLLMLVFNVCLRQVYRHSYMASYSIYNIHTRWVFLLSSAVVQQNTRHQGNVRTINHRAQHRWNK